MNEIGFKRIFFVIVKIKSTFKIFPAKRAFNFDDEFVFISLWINWHLKMGVVAEQSKRQVPCSSTLRSSCGVWVVSYVAMIYGFEGEANLTFNDSDMQRTSDTGMHECRSMNGQRSYIGIQTLAFILRQPIFKRALPSNTYNSTLPDCCFKILA